MSHEATTSLCGGVLAGGESRRMGRDKAELRLEETTFLQRIVRACRGAVDRLFVVGRRAEDAPRLDAGGLDVAFVPDDRPDLGPIGGLTTALRRAGAPVLLLPCDMPLIDATAVEWLADQWHSVVAETGDAPPDALVGTGDQDVGADDIEPFFSVYSPAMIPIAEAMIDDDTLALRELIDRADTRALSLPEWVGRRLVNVNTPADYRDLRRGESADAHDSPFPFWQTTPK